MINQNSNFLMDLPTIIGIGFFILAPNSLVILPIKILIGLSLTYHLVESLLQSLLLIALLAFLSSAIIAPLISLLVFIGFGVFQIAQYLLFPIYTPDPLRTIPTPLPSQQNFTPECNIKNNQHKRRPSVIITDYDNPNPMHNHTVII